MMYRVKHATTYTYTSPVAMCHNEAHLAPRSHVHQSVVRSQIEVRPEPEDASTHTDYFGNDVTFFAIQEPHDQLVVHATSLVEVLDRGLPPAAQSTPWEEVRRLVREHRDAETLSAYQFAFESPFIKTSEALAAYARPSFTPDRPIVEAAFDLTRRIHREFRYDPAATTVATPIAEVLRARRGVCQDFAHVMIGCVRSIGLPIRYVSGYLRSRTDAASPCFIGADASHAWVSIFAPPWGWVDLDPTNDVMVNTGHVTVAWGRDYDDVSPIKGVILGGGGEHTIGVAVEVLPA